MRLISIVPLLAAALAIHACASGESLTDTTFEEPSAGSGGASPSTGGVQSTTAPQGGSGAGATPSVVGGGAGAGGGGAGAIGNTGTGGSAAIPDGGSEPFVPVDDEPCPDPADKRCGGICVRPSPGVGCTLDHCTPCPSPPLNGFPHCDGTTCSFLCANGYEAVESTCEATGAGPDAGPVPVSCQDGVLNGTESDVDCGGTECNACPDGKVCASGSDCASRSCDTTTAPSTCLPPSCNDGIQNALETDVDCGGNCGATCAPGEGCAGTGDCAYGTCADGICDCTPSCPTNQCGASLADGCGGTLACGCPGASDVCVAGTCCSPVTTCPVGQCGTISNGCGGSLNCSTNCSPGDVCNGGTCCTPNTCTDFPGQCGTLGNGCGGSLNCTASCPDGDVCNSGTCCTPSSCADFPGQCGNLSNGCGGTLNCTANCPEGDVCNGGLCCTPSTCANFPDQCGNISNGCGGTLSCACPDGDSCHAGTCCTPFTCADFPGQCGNLGNGCGGSIDCAANCPGGDVCNAGTCCTPLTCADVPGTCGTVSNGCGGTITCEGSCPIFRVTEYPVSTGSSTQEITLNQNLVPDYFVLVRGSRANNNPDDIFARLDRDPWGTGQLTASGAPNRIRIRRQSGTGTWVGVVTVVESLRAQTTSGFRLLHVQSVTVGTDTLSGSFNVPAESAWSDLDRVMVFGGPLGAGSENDSGVDDRSSRVYVNAWPSGSTTVQWARGQSGSTRTQYFTYMVLQWGSEWTVQRTSVTGSASGASADTVGAYDTATLLTPVPRANTFVWGLGYTSGSGISDSGEGSIVTLGNGVDAQATESSVAVGQQASTTKSFTVYAMTHPQLVVDHGFVPSTTAPTSASTIDIATSSAAGCTPDLGGRMALAYTGMAPSSSGWPRSLWSARYLNDTTIRLHRTETGGNVVAAWVQGIQFCNILTPP
jgi:hypothetical protein